MQIERWALGRLMSSGSCCVRLSALTQQCVYYTRGVELLNRSWKDDSRICYFKDTIIHAAN